MAQQLIKRIVCLAASRMRGGRCIAGKELLGNGQPGRWIRPVNGVEGLGLSYSESRYVDGGIPRLLDIMEVPVRQWLPEHHQRENWLIDTNRYWKKVGSLSTSNLHNWADEVESLWVNDKDNRSNDRVGGSDAKGLETSLYLIKADLSLKVANYDTLRGVRRRVQGRFCYNGTEYSMWVTDPVFEQEYKKKPDNIYRINECYLCVSLGGIFEGSAYKLIAAIMKP